MTIQWFDLLLYLTYYVFLAVYLSVEFPEVAASEWTRVTGMPFAMLIILLDALGEWSAHGRWPGLRTRNL